MNRAASLAALAMGAGVLAFASRVATAPAELPPAAYVFYEAVTKGDTSTVESMLSDSPEFARLKYKHDVTALHAAALADEPRTVELLIRRGAFVDARGGQLKLTPLFLAVQQGHGRVVAALLAHRADPNATGAVPSDLTTVGADNLRPLHIAAISGRTDIADLLVQRGALLGPKSSTGETACDYARRIGGAPVSLMLEAYRTLGVVRGRPVAALIRAIEAGDSTAVDSQLTRQPALANFTLDGGWKPLHFAAMLGHRSVCDALLAHRADPRAEEPATHWTPALRAFDAGHRELCEYLRRREAEAPQSRR
jgi:ankyrin repeat protein